MSKILYVEDEPFLAKIVMETLQGQGYEVTHIEDGQRVIDEFEVGENDICILDIMLPHVNGYDIATHIRKKDSNVPIIFLTAKDQTEDVVRGFKTGGNDYLRKPFSIEELIVRIESLILRSSAQSDTLNHEGIALGAEATFYPARLELVIEDSIVKLSHKESLILEMLSNHQNQVLQRKDLLLLAWGDDSFFNSRTLDVYISKLRGYLKPIKDVEIVTLKGVGYRFLVGK